MKDQNIEAETANTPVTLEQAEKALAAYREAAHQAIAKHHVAILDAFNGLERIGAKPDYERSLIMILKKFGSSNLAFIQQVLPDSQMFGKARKSLLESGRILESTEGTRKTLSLAEQPVAA